MRLLVQAGMRRTTLLLCAIFFGVAFTYYGLVLLTTNIHAEGAACMDSKPDIDASAYVAVFFDTSAELPGLLMAALLVEHAGRVGTLTSSMFLCGVCYLLMLLPLEDLATTGALFVARGGVMCAFTMLYIYAPEVFPTSVRATGVGLCNSMARIGGSLAPAAGVLLIGNGRSRLAEAVLAFVSLATSGAAANLEVETSGRGLEVRRSML